MITCPKCGWDQVPDEEQLHIDLGLDCSTCFIHKFISHTMREKTCIEQIFPSIRVDP